MFKYNIRKRDLFQGFRRFPTTYAVGRATPGSASLQPLSWPASPPSISLARWLIFYYTKSALFSVDFNFSWRASHNLKIIGSQVDRIRRDGRARPVRSLCGVSVRFRPRPVPESKKMLRTARIFFRPLTPLRILSAAIQRSHKKNSCNIFITGVLKKSIFLCV